MISVYDKFESIFTHNGRVLSDCISCLIAEELNGAYELTLEYPLDERGKWQELLEGNIIKADDQLFRIYHKIKTLNGIKVNARHIFYDLLDNFLEDVRPTNLSGYGALDWILTHTQYSHNFTSLGDVGGTNTKYYIRKNVIEAIMGSDGIINTWGGELVRDNFEIKLLGARGLDRGVLVSYGKNIQGIEETLDIDGICTRLMPIGKDGLLLPEKYIDSPYILNFPHPKIRVVEFTDYETVETLRAAGQDYMLNNKIDIPQFNYKIDFLELSKTEEYKNYAVLERVYLADTVTIKHSKLNINLKAKVIKITKNILTNRIEKVELGSFKPNLATSINNSIQSVKNEIVQVKSAYQQAIDNATALIIGSNGGNVVMHQNEAGQIDEILIMDTTDVMTAEQVWRWNSGGFGHSNTGYNGPFDTAITQDGHIVGAFITALEISGEQITAGIIKSKNGKWQLNLDGETFNLGDKLIFDGTNLTFGSGVTLSWGDITDQPTIPTQYTNAEALAAWVASGYKTYINSSGVYTGKVVATNIEGGTLTLGGLNNTSGIYYLKDASNNNLVTMSNLGLKSYNNGGKLATWLTGGGFDFYDWWVAGANKIASIYVSGSLGAGGVKGIQFDLSSGVGTYMSWSAHGVTMFDIETTRDASERITFYPSVKFNSVIYSWKHAINGNEYYCNSGGDGAAYNNYNSAIASWFGIGLHSTVDDTTRTIFNPRTGEISTQGAIYGASKSNVTETENYGQVITYADESPNHIHIDRGIGEFDENGVCLIALDPIWLDTVSTKMCDYWVMLTSFEGTEAKIRELQPDYFTVVGTPYGKFMWRVEAERKGYERQRFNTGAIDY